MSNNTGAIKIVCIEDDPEMIDLVKLILTRKGYNVTGATNGPDGLEAVAQVKPDLVLLDLMMRWLNQLMHINGFHLLHSS